MSKCEECKHCMEMGKYLLKGLKEGLKKELTDDEKLKLINSMEIIEDSASCGEAEYIIVEDSENNRNVLHEIGFDDAYIKDNCHPEEGYLDITTIGFKYAQYYNMKKKCFYNENCSGSPITVKTLED